MGQTLALRRGGGGGRGFTHGLVARGAGNMQEHTVTHAPMPRRVLWGQAIRGQLYTRDLVTLKLTIFFPPSYWKLL